MKIALLAAAAVIVSTAAVAQEMQTIDLDGDVSMTLSKGWKAETSANPAMKMKSMRDLMVGASETRLKRGSTGVMVSYMHFKSKGPAKVMDEAELGTMDGTTKMAAAQYLRQSVETEVSPRSQLVGELGVSLATLTARDGQKFNVGAGYSGGCVTTGSVRRGAAVWAVSVVSDSCETETHKEAVEALFAASSA